MPTTPITITCTKDEATAALKAAAGGAAVSCGLDPDPELGRDPMRQAFHRHRVTVGNVTVGHAEMWGVPVNEIVDALRRRAG